MTYFITPVQHDQLQVNGDDITSGAKNDITDGDDFNDASNSDVENGHSKEEEQNEEEDSNSKCACLYSQTSNEKDF